MIILKLKIFTISCLMLIVKNNYANLHEIASLVFNKYNNPNIIHESQSITYLKNSNFLEMLKIKSPKYKNYIYEKNITKIDKSTLIKIFNKAINREIKNQEAYVFYHGQNIKFLLYQDLYKKILKKIYSKKIIDFIPLRIPNLNSYKYKNINYFLEKHKKHSILYANRKSDSSKNYKQYSKFNSINDTNQPYRSLLLSVNASIFDNMVGNKNSSSLYYFLTSSNLNSIDNLTLIKELFKHFNLNFNMTYYI